MRPTTARSLAALIVGGATLWLWRLLDPEGFQPIGAILAYAWLVFPASVAYIFVDVLLMEWFGARTAEGKAEAYVDPTQVRLERIERAIDRLHSYVQELDPELAEERQLKAEFMSGNGGIFAGMNHMEYVRDREQAGKRTLNSHSIWSEPD